jgi:hypothetical protein
MAIEADGMLWKPSPGAAASAEEFLRARSLITQLHQAVCWNPWLLEDRADEYAAAWEVCSQWTRAEPDYRPPAAEELEAGYERRMAEADARFEEQETRAECERAERAAHYDPDRAHARLALLEERGVLAEHIAKRDETASRPGYDSPSKERRKAQLAWLDKTIAALETEIARLGTIVGEEETVCDEAGWLPSERREQSLVLFAARRVTEVRELRRRVAARQSELKTVTGRGERAAIRKALRKDTVRLAHLEAMPPMTAAQMCSECPWPADRHTVGVTYGLAGEGELTGPCDGWPRWAQQRREMKQKLTELLTRPAEPLPPPPPKPQPLAIIPSGLPIEEVMAQLAAIQAEHPGAHVRHGTRNRWEVWPAEQATADPT